MNISGNECLDALLYDQNQWKRKINFNTYFTIAYSKNVWDNFQQLNRVI